MRIKLKALYNRFIWTYFVNFGPVIVFPTLSAISENMHTDNTNIKSQIFITNIKLVIKYKKN